VQARFRRAERDPERNGDLRQGQVEVVMQDDEGSRFRLEAAEARSSWSRSTMAVFGSSRVETSIGAMSTSKR
jgi:hypothetical protein